MINTQKRKKLVAIQILFMLATSTLTVNYANGEISESPMREKTKVDKVQLVLSEKIIDGKLKLRYFGVLGDLQPKDIQDFLYDKGVRTGWVYLDGEVFNSGIILYNGKSLKIGGQNASDQEVELSYQIIFSAKSSKNPETKFAIIIIDSEPKITQQNLKLNHLSHF